MAHRRFGQFYKQSFDRRPWLTLAVTNGLLGAVADTTAQTLERIQKRREAPNDDGAVQSSQWDLARTSRFFAFGVGMAPLLAEWNRFVEFRFPLRTAGAAIGKVSNLALGKRVAVDQIMFAPFGLACFFGAMGLMEGRSLEGLKRKFRETYEPALIANWQVWPLVQTINFRFMPLRYRVPFTGAIGIAWQVFLSILNASKGRSSTQELGTKIS